MGSGCGVAPPNMGKLFKNRNSWKIQPSFHIIM